VGGKPLEPPLRDSRFAPPVSRDSAVLDRRFGAAVSPWPGITAAILDRMMARSQWVIWADDLPKTRSGKIMRRLLRDIAEGRELGDVTTLRDPGVMQRLEQLVREPRDQEDGAWRQPR
jgi:hypothetical protein